MNDLTKTIKALEELILSSSGAEPFEEVLKIIYAKIYAEKHKLKNQTLQTLFTDAKKEWPGIFKKTDKIELPDNTLALCAKILENTYLYNTDLEILDIAFEYLFPKTSKGNKGQFFTPRHIISEIIQILNPQKDETLLDPACGSAGFLLYSMKHTPKLNPYNLSGIDFDNRMVKIAKASCLILGLENINIYNANALAPSTEIKEKTFDIIATNPPFGGEIKDPNILKNFELPPSRHILFIEKIVKLLKPGGRAAIILPQGILNNTNLAPVREWLFAKTRIVGVISLDPNTFKPHTNVKTSILFIQKWKDKPLLDYPIFMAVSEKSGKNTSGKKTMDCDLPEITEKIKKFISHEKLWNTQ